jgi:lipopolysaccharide/colanic/teichoic acid biosynthesis glycosyltransferase
MFLGERTIFGEVLFGGMLKVERCRTDRSHRPFLLLLLELDPRLRDAQRKRQRLVKQVVRALQDCTRQTDIIGWYKPRTVIGVIFTELTQQAPAIRKIQTKVEETLRAQLAPEQINMISLSFHLYPHQDPNTCHDLVNETLYPDLKRKKLPRLGKRLIDLFVSTGLLLLLLPVFGFIGLAIKLTSKGPILFKQQRIGQFGKPFTFLKFRSMVVGADSTVHEKYVKDFIRWGSQGSDDPDVLKQDGFFKLTRDSRITPLGSFLRKTSLDELPQLFNVFLGDMTLVGPRPPIAYEVEHYETWHTRRVWEAKPGLTGLWQVKGRSRTTFDDMVRLDLTYIDTWSAWTDIKILLQTPMAVLRGEGAH